MIKHYMLLLPSDDELQDFINKSEARRTFQGTPCFAQERLAFDSAVRETINRLHECLPLDGDNAWNIKKHNACECGATIK